MTGLHLGKQAAADDPRTLKLSRYLDLTAVPKIPAHFGHEDKMPTPRLMLGNGPDDTVHPGFQGAGDCVFAMICNAVRLANGIAGRTVRFTGKEAIAAYSQVTGYRIGDAATDRGTVMHDALNWWRTTGIKDADGKVHRLGAYVAIDLTSHDLTKVFQALHTLDIGIGIGINFPSTAMGQFAAHKPWKPVTGATSEGGHAVLLDARRTYPKVETWARDQDVTIPFLRAQADEAYALLTEEMLVSGKSPEGLDIAGLKADLALL